LVQGLETHDFYNDHAAFFAPVWKEFTLDLQIQFKKLWEINPAQLPNFLKGEILQSPILSYF
jgi:hypothetical protein